MSGREKGNDSSEKGHLLEWNIVSLEQINLLLNLTVEELEVQLKEILNFKNYQTCLKEAALLDYFVSGFWWAKEMNFTCQQVSCFMALLQLLLDNIREKQMPFVDNYKEFAKAIAGTRKSLSSEDDASPLFDVDQAIAITDYFRFGLFQHYKMYEFLFTQPREERVFKMEETIEVISPGDFAAPLEEGMPTDVFFRYMAPAPVEQPGEADISEESGVQEQAASAGTD
ncbi:ciliary-associated calcium-binding coiled-coil protein 1 [Megalops cyprinoides]|uniref:ciliary-associated calcium-binding coiled-coil protein 1 n=1 Tax=Megalops cyprinoides TaxID=118141 RepID=UPI001864CC19|nr:ciliary-associated calcium-binding coiled-coil protein 1 [Megalops cyprinoides]